MQTRLSGTNSYHGPIFACALAVALLITGCSDDIAENPQGIEAVDRSLPVAGETNAETKPGVVAAGVAIPGAQSQASREQIISISFAGITLVGTNLSRNTLIRQLVEIDKAWLLGDPLTDRQIDIDLRSQSMGAVLGYLLDDVNYQARFERHENSRATLHTLWIGDSAFASGSSPRDDSAASSAGLASPVTPVDGSIDAGEEHVKLLSSRFSGGDKAEKISVIIESELTEGGVAFLNHILQNEQDPEILIEVIRRLESGEEFGAKWALLQSLSHPNPKIQLEILESIEAWRDPTIRMYVAPLTTHYDASVRDKALELVDSLNSYAEAGIAADPYGVDKVSPPPSSAEQREQRALKVEQRLKREEERSRNREHSVAE